MRLYLVRHGRAVTPEENPERPLSKDGRDDIERMASFLARSKVRPERILHSGKARAAETALILATTLGDSRVVAEMPGISPMDSPRHLVEAARAWPDDTMVCGHNPNMERVAATLLTGNDLMPVAAFATGQIMCLERDDGVEGWTMRWHLRPSLLRG